MWQPVFTQSPQNAPRTEISQLPIVRRNKNNDVHYVSIEFPYQNICNTHDNRELESLAAKKR